MDKDYRQGLRRRAKRGLVAGYIRELSGIASPKGKRPKRPATA